MNLPYYLLAILLYKLVCFINEIPHRFTLQFMYKGTLVQYKVLFFFKNVHFEIEKKNILHTYLPKL